MREIEYGRFSDSSGTYSVASSAAPNTIRVYAEGPGDRSMLCTISGITGTPTASWGVTWLHCSAEWYDAMQRRALDTYRGATCDGRAVER
ncbi:hypothetical protein LX16_4839 [Stackebrandtia albiflava]|uniref:Uncharacterized protein n=1 Tax=Stackebrandtia albiflava TaxID=406432 RepID=A0A562UPY4_9ACTN|nr:hypothetical protein [Stackebrandtia albiflava]TWJ07680.1 hypothetical protein LX16_4839 [Stackebrandtia albiflava]